MARAGLDPSLDVGKSPDAGDITHAGERAGESHHVDSPLQDLLEALRHLFSGFRKVRHPLASDGPTIQELPIPLRLHLPVGPGPLQAHLATHKVGDEVEAGAPLWSAGRSTRTPCPVRGKVADLVNVPDIRGAGPTSSVTLEALDEALAAPWPPLDPGAAPRDALLERIRAAGVSTGGARPWPLADLLELGTPVILNTLDSEPAVSATSVLLRERASDVTAAAALLSRIADAPVQVAVAAGGPVGVPGVTALEVPPVYPQSLPQMLEVRAGHRASVVDLHAAMAALDAVREGRIQSARVVTVIGPDRKPLANLRVALGTPMRVVLEAADALPEEGDKVVAGTGPMRGFAQFSLDAPVDAGVEALVLVRGNELRAWANQPCVSGGQCVEICPVQLQAGAIGRYAEFGLFERTEALGIDHCIECGLCATVCSAHRPLIQFIRLAKRELAMERALRREAGAP